MTQSVELVLDETTDAAVRAQWAGLESAGLPSQARHTQPSNRPHVTLVAQDRIDPSAELAMAAECAALPLAIRLGALMLFGHGRFVLVRAVLADTALLRLQQEVQAAAGRPSPQMEPGRWVPHVTLAHRMTAAQVATGLAVLTGLPGGGREAPTPSYAVAARRWDSEAKREWLIA